MRKYEFFEGLNGDGVVTTLEEYTDGSAPWRVHTMGHNADGFWLLLSAPSD